MATILPLQRRGQWSAESVYFPGDVVVYQDSTYVCASLTTGGAGFDPDKFVQLTSELASLILLATGPSGEPGRSAYQVAQEAGYTGSVNQWLASLASQEAGPAGPANTLTVGTVTAGDTASVTITGTAPNQTINLNLPRGLQGLQGLQGTPGTPGTPGQTGAPGQDGIDGTDGREIEVRSANGYLQWRYRNTGIWLNILPLTDIKGEKGDTGQTGLTGERGIQGETGARGLTGVKGDMGLQGYDGASAYELALGSGFTGTMQEWLDSLVGPEGPQGETGLPGTPGAPGQDGQPGLNRIQDATDFVATPGPGQFLTFGDDGAGNNVVNSATLNFVPNPIFEPFIGEFNTVQKRVQSILAQTSPWGNATAYHRASVSARLGSETSTAYALPALAPRAYQIDLPEWDIIFSISFFVTNPVTGSTLRLALYRNTPTGLDKPGELITDLGLVSTSSAGKRMLQLSDSVSSAQLATNKIFIAFKESHAGVGFRNASALSGDDVIGNYSTSTTAITGAMASITGDSPTLNLPFETNYTGTFNPIVTRVFPVFGLIGLNSNDN